jgi:hypothetical protein
VERKNAGLLGTQFYDNHAFAKAKNMNNHCEQQALGNVAGKSKLHLRYPFW